jgi:hypothetical protein
LRDPRIGAAARFHDHDLVLQRIIGRAEALLLALRRPDGVNRIRQRLAKPRIHIEARAAREQAEGNIDVLRIRLPLEPGD